MDATALAAAPVDMSSIELQKENILPLASGRSAAQLASLSTHSLSGLGSKNSLEHKRFQTQIDAIAAYDAAGGVWEDGRDGLSSDELEQLSADPLDLHVRYARFVLANYPAGNSAQSKLVPILEASTRRFIKDDRYTNDPRYLRLWGLYAKHVEDPADCYCFLFSRGIGERVGLLYEEYAAALEANGKRREADEIYTIGVARGAVPVDRLKKKHAAFKARMLVAPPLPPSPPPAAAALSSSTSREARPILAGPGVGSSKPAPSLVKGNSASSFAVFQDGAESEAHERGKDWEDLGTVKSRKKENDIEASAWKGETLPMTAAPKAGALRLEVFRDEDAPATHPAGHAVVPGDAFSRSLRGPSETELLVKNPLKNYSDADLSLISNTSIPRPAPPAAPAAAPKSKTSSSRKPKVEVAKTNPDGTKAEAIGCDIHAVYPSEGVEFSFEEIKIQRRQAYQAEADSWNGWEWLESTSPAPSSASPLRSFAAPARQPSPTINTRNAQAMVDSLFQHTIKLDEWNDDEEREEEEDDEDEEPDTEEEEDAPFWSTMPPSQLEMQSQMTQSSSQASSVMAPFGLSQGIGDSMIASQFSVMSDLPEEDDDVLAPSRTISPSLSMATIVYADEENAPARPSPMRLFHDPAAPVTISTSPSVPFRPVRAPLGAKPTRAFEVMPDPASAEDEEAAGEDEVPSSQPDESDIEESFEQPLRSEEEPRSQSGPFGDGFSRGRQAKGRNPWAAQIDNLTPITERTLEYTAASSLSTSQRSRRGSVYPQPLPVEEDDEDEEPSTDDEYAGDQAFVAGFASEDSASASDRSGSDSDDSDAEEPEPEQEQERPFLEVPHAPVAHLRASTTSGDSSDWHDSTRKDGHFDDDDLVADLPNVSVVSSVQQDRSFDASLNTSLPEGFTITGNQSGMNTAMVLGETTRLDQSAPPFANPCNPFDASTISHCLNLASPAALALPHVHDLTCSSANRLPDLQKTAKRREAALKSKSKDRTGVIDKPWTLELDGETFVVRQKLGEGAYGAVFQVARPASATSDPDASFSSSDDSDVDVAFAVKVEEPTNLWEYHILSQLHARLPPAVRPSVVRAHALYAFRDESYLFLDFSDQGTLLDVVNKANESGVAPPTGGVASGLDEVVAMFFIVELIRVMEGFHNSGFLHGDLKIDNCLVRFDDVPGGSSKWSTAYDRTGAGGWASKGVKVIDFGRTVDLTAFPADQRFRSDLVTHETDCREMREEQSWTFEPDYFGIAAIAFNVLFGRNIETRLEPDGRVVIAQSFRRYHQVDLWTRLFDAMLNPKQVRPDASLPITNELGAIRSDMELWLEANSKLKNLRSLIRKLEAFAMARGR
ncbi:hypothetical protein RQP46_007469 [Phenoliferia psychrophenolica]